MKKVIYMIICVILNVVAIVIFREHIRITELSSMSAVFMLVLAFLSWSFTLTVKGDMPLNVGGSTELNDDEISRLARMLCNVCFGMIPLLIPFIFFFSDTIKTVVPVALLCSAVIVGALAFRILYGKSIKARLEAEENEKNEQQKREQ